MSLLEQRIAAGKARGEMLRGADPANLARYIAAVIQGMSVQAQDRADEATLVAIAEIALAAWPSRKASSERRGKPRSSADVTTRHGGRREAMTDHKTGWVVHLHNHDVAFHVVSRAPLAKLQAYKRRMGWRFPWASSYGSDFNYDFHVSHTEEEWQSGLSTKTSAQWTSGCLKGRRTPSSPI